MTSAVAEPVHMVEAIRRTLLQEMERDESIVTISEFSSDDSLSGVDLRARFGNERCIELPAEDGMLAQTAVGLAAAGLRPVLELSNADFAVSALDGLIGEASRLRYRTGGEYLCKMVVRIPVGGGVHGGPFLSGTLDSLLAHVPGLKVLTPSDPAAAVQMLRHAVRSEDPVILLEPKVLTRSVKAAVDLNEDVPATIGARWVRGGDDAVIVSWGSMVSESIAAAETCESHGISAAVLDLQTLSPLDEAAIISAVAERGRVIVVDEAPRSGGLSAEVAARIADRALLHLEAPVIRVTGLDAPVPFIHEDLYRPDARRIAAEVERVVDF